MASLGVQLFTVSLLLLIPLIFRDQLPVVHWKDIVVGPPPPPPAPIPVRPAQSPGSSNREQVVAHRPFVWNPKANLESPVSTATDFTPEAPPVVGMFDGIGGRTNATFIPNVVAAPPPPPPPAPVDKNLPSRPVPVGGDVQMAKVLRKVIPEYPALARSARISGAVHLIGIIGKDGTIRNLQVVSGHPLLVHAAMEAVRQWVYQPTLLNGMPVEVIAPIEVNFTLGQ